MAKVKHATMVGLLTFDEERGYLVDGFPVADVLEECIDRDVQFDLIALERSPQPPQNPPPPPEDDIIRRLGLD